jgi:hypothetical protein
VRATALLSSMTGNRKAFFDLVEALEREASCEIDVVRLQGLIDAHYSGRAAITTAEARLLLLAVSYPPVDVTDLIERNENRRKP